MLWLADNDPLKIAAYEKLSIVEYYMMLNKKDEDIKKLNKINKKTNKV